MSSTHRKWLCMSSLLSWNGQDKSRDMYSRWTITLRSFCEWVSERILTHCSATRGLLATDHVILNHGQVTWKTPEVASPLLTTTPHRREDISALDRFNVHCCPTRRVFSGTGFELMTCLPRSDTLNTGLPQSSFCEWNYNTVVFIIS
ncbi:uncharacterized protein TNCV_3562741 [Trichonephila clavipes]|nr:uncharacterized protein TNCV_3562741 [Trichonephila clavipes]